MDNIPPHFFEQNHSAPLLLDFTPINTTSIHPEPLRQPPEPYRPPEGPFFTSEGPEYQMSCPHPPSPLSDPPTAGPVASEPGNKGKRKRYKGKGNGVQKKVKTNTEEGSTADASQDTRDATKPSKANKRIADLTNGVAAKRLKVLGIWAEPGSTDQTQRKVRHEIRRLANEICITDAKTADDFDWCLLIEQILMLPEMKQNWVHWSPGGARSKEKIASNPAFYDAINSLVVDSLKKVTKPVRDAIKERKQKMLTHEIQNSLPALRKHWEVRTRPLHDRGSTQEPSSPVGDSPNRLVSDDLPALGRNRLRHTYGVSAPPPPPPQPVPECEETVCLVVVDPSICSPTDPKLSIFPWKWPGKDSNLRFQLVSLESRSMTAFVSLCRDSISDETRRIRELWGIVCPKTTDDSPPLEEASELSSDSSLRAWLRETSTFRRYAYCVLRRTESGGTDTPRAIGKVFNEYNFVSLPPIIDLDEDNDHPALVKGPTIPRATTAAGFTRWCGKIDRRIIRLRRLRHLVCQRANKVLDITDFNPPKVDASEEPWNRPEGNEDDPGRDYQQLCYEIGEKVEKEVAMMNSAEVLGLHVDTEAVLTGPSSAPRETEMDIHGDMSTAAGTSTLGAEQPPDHPSPIISSASSPLSSPPCSPPVPGPSADHMRNTPGYLDDELDETSHKRARTAAPEEKIGAKGSTTSTRGYTPAGQGPGEEKPETQVHAPK